MIKQIIDVENLVTDKNKEKIFLGDYSGFQRYDNPKYLFATQMEEKQRNAFWNPNEITMLADSQKYPELPEEIQEVMKRVWLFQTLMDSGQNKGLEEVLAGLSTNPEFEGMFKTWGYFEYIHSLSYSHILRGIFPDSSKIFDEIANYPEIQHRIDKEINLYSEVEYYTHKWNHDDLTPEEVETFKKKIIELIVSVFFLEGIKFYISFLVTYIINNAYGNKIAGSTRIIKLINFDEDLHTEMSRGLLKILRDNKDEGFSKIFEGDWYSELAQSLAKEVYEDELEWAKYLLSVADIPSLTIGVTEQFLKYYIDFRLGELDVEPIFNQQETDVVKWFKIYKDMNKDNAALQESDLSVYSIGIIRDDIPSGKIEI